MDLSYYFCIGLVLALLLSYRPNKLWQAALSAYWLVLLAWALRLIQPFHYRSISWSSQLGINFSWHIDGLARLFTLLISGIGVLIFIYAAIYAQGQARKRAKLLALLQTFAVSMLGIVLSDNSIVLFLAWELTTITSYLLIQFDVTDNSANQAAFNGMFISVLGGLAMLAGFILLQQLSGSWSISASIQKLTHAPSLTPAFCLILLGVITKSAQFPFYFWLPGAMKAPTPVSAYLHSATMVNAGIYVLARFHPLFSHLSLWYPTLAFFGISTMLVSGVLSLFQRDLKAILAYTTLFALGSMVYLLAGTQRLAAEAFALFLLFHALYKATAFMWVGTIDRTYGSRDINTLRGIGRRWPAASIVAVIALSAMAGLPPFFGFSVKEMLFDAKLAGGSISYSLMALSLFSSMLIAAASLKCLYYWFVGEIKTQMQKKLAYGLLCALILSAVILCLEILQPLLTPLLNSAADSILHINNVTASLSPGVSTQLSLITVIGGVILLLCSEKLKHHQIKWPAYLNPLLIFEASLKAILSFGRKFTYLTQNQGTNKQLSLIFIALVIVLAAALFHNHSGANTLHWQASTWPICVLSILLIISAASLLSSKRFLINMISLAVLGLLISAVFVLQGAPDVAMTQLLVEILSVVILVIALRKATLKEAKLTSKHRLLHASIAIAIGAIVTDVLFLISNSRLNTHLSQYFIQHSLSSAHGRNVVNVILVDFRAFDTLGEVLVIFATALAIWLVIDKQLLRKQKQLRD